MLVLFPVDVCHSGGVGGSPLITWPGWAVPPSDEGTDGSLRQRHYGYHPPVIYLVRRALLELIKHLDPPLKRDPDVGRQIQDE